MKLILLVRSWSQRWRVRFHRELQLQFQPQLALVPVSRRKNLRSNSAARIARPHHYARLPLL